MSGASGSCAPPKASACNEITLKVMSIECPAGVYGKRERERETALSYLNPAASVECEWTLIL